MKYQYSTEVLNLKDGDYFVFKMQEELEVVEMFLNSDVQGGGSITDDMLSNIDMVIKGEKEVFNFGGNTCLVSVKKDFTRIEMAYFKGQVNTIETCELRKLIGIFLSEKTKFINENKSIQHEK